MHQFLVLSRLEIRGSAGEVCDTNLESNSRAPPGDWETTEHYNEGSVPTPQDVVCLMACPTMFRNRQVLADEHKSGEPALETNDSGRGGF